MLLYYKDIISILPGTLFYNLKYVLTCIWNNNVYFDEVIVVYKRNIGTKYITLARNTKTHDQK